MQASAPDIDHHAALASNLALWNEWADVNARSEFYDVEAFRAGRLRLHSLEVEEVGDVSGKRLLHLQCHFGLDTLSWARLGAQVTGVDFSDRAIALAESLAADMDIPSRFIHSTVYDLPQVLDGEFDIVYTSYGAICWLPDIEQWAQVAARYLRPGGTFYMAEFHPFLEVFDDERCDEELRVRYPYFHTSEPLTFPVHGSYADANAEVNTPLEHLWTHPISDVVSALAAAGLRIEYLHEHDVTVFPQIAPAMEQGEDGYWRLRRHGRSVPLMYSIKAEKC